MLSSEPVLYARKISMSSVSTIRERLGMVHIETPYYAQVEHPAWIAIFWDKDSLFRRMFNQLELSAVIELACGHGRHTEQIIDRSPCITLVDINEQNIAACRARFAGRNNVYYGVNNGVDLSDFADGSASALFSYDAMVHFEASDVIGYLTEFARLLRQGGRALLHYSNCEDFPEGTYEDGPHWRSFFSEKMMRHFANRAGFKTVESHTLPWPPGNTDAPHIDAVTLLEKL